MSKALAASILGVCATASVATAAPIERRLHATEIEASSFLQNDWNKYVENYHPNYVADDDPATAWVEGAPGSGAGEWLRLHVTSLDRTTHVRLHVRDGYQKSKSLFAANARAKQVTLRLLPGKTEVHATLADQDGWQDIAIDQPSGALTAIELHVDSVYEGAKYADLCLSDVQVFATSETADNPALEKAHQKVLLDWRAARLATAKAFAGKATELPLAASYETKLADGKFAEPWKDDQRWPGSLPDVVAAMQQDPAFRDGFAEPLVVARGVVHDLDALSRAQLAPAANVRLPEVDGVQQMTFEAVFALQGAGLIHPGELHLPMLDTVASLFVDQLRVVDLKDKETPTAWLASKRKCTDADQTRAWSRRVVPGGGGAPAVRALVVATCGRIETREGHYDVRGLELLVYGADGRLALVIGNNHADGYRWSADAGRPLIASAHSLTMQGDVQAAELTARRPTKP